MSSKYTCITCRVAFNDIEIQRQHYKADWHRYNLKRKVAELPPVTAEDFQKKVLKQRHDDAEDSKNSATYCMVCKKSFKTAKAFDNHSNSKQHHDKLEENTNSVESSDLNDIENVNGNMEISCPSIGKITEKRTRDEVSQFVEDSDEFESDSDIDSDDSGWEVEISENNPILKNNCLFCSHHSRSQMKNLVHMTVVHSFFIPDAEYLVDLKGLLLYLGEKVCMGFMCLWCNDKGKSFYSMESAQQHMTDKGHCKMLHEGETLAEYADYYDYRASYPDHESMEIDEEIDVNVIDGNDYQLVLPSGATIGHRSLMKYYRQNFDPNRIVVPYRGKMNKVLSQYRALGYKESDKLAVVKKARDINFMRRVQNKYSMMLGTKANKLQKHFRQQVNF